MLKTIAIVFVFWLELTYCRHKHFTYSFYLLTPTNACLALRFSSKKAKYEVVHKLHQAITEQGAVILEKRKAHETIRHTIEMKRWNIELLRNEVEKRRAMHKAALAEKEALIKSLAETRKKFPQYNSNVDHLKHFVERRNLDNENKTVRRSELQTELQRRIQQRIETLVRYIFPISRVLSRSEHSEVTEVPNRVSELAEATRTAYVRGRWVLQDSHHELHHAVVAPSLPGNGDYSEYIHWITSNKDGVPIVGTGGGGAGASGVETQPSQNPAYRISGALTYTTQMVDLLSYYLDIHLPFKVQYG